MSSLPAWWRAVRSKEGKMMKQAILTRDPAAYARELIAQWDIKEPPVSELVIADYLGLSVKEFKLSEIDVGEELRREFAKACVWLRRRGDGSGTIYVSAEMTGEMKRLSVLHECAHAALPWHAEADYSCNEKDIISCVGKPDAREQSEREAFEFATEVLMPTGMFAEDITSMSLRMRSILELSEQYLAPVEATAARFVKLHPKPCAVVLVVECPTPKGGYSLMVRYCFGSSLFPEHVPEHSGVSANSFIRKAWSGSAGGVGVVAASELRLASGKVYEAECHDLGLGKLLVLLTPVPAENIIRTLL
jgi:hypothetical protein